MSFYGQVILFCCGFVLGSTAVAGDGREEAAGLRRSYWPNPNNIIVCWDTSGYATEKALVKSAIRSSWEAHSALRFTSWRDCGTGHGDIRIQIGEYHPHVVGLGTQLRNKRGGMKLNFRFTAPEFSESFGWCRTHLHSCIKTIAIHEFGHAIGLAHEQNRPDAPEVCRLLHQGTTPDHLITVYDPHSVMNYCSRRVSLSTGDIQAVKILYGAQEGECSLMQNKDIHSGSMTTKHGHRSDECCGLCSRDPTCKGFAWNSYMGGTCYLKTEATLIVNAPGVISGVLQSRRAKCTLQQNKDIQSGQQISRSGFGADQCCDLCGEEPSCKGFAWNDWNGGTCYLKTDTGEMINSDGVISGVLLSGTTTL